MTKWVYLVLNTTKLWKRYNVMHHSLPNVCTAAGIWSGYVISRQYQLRLIAHIMPGSVLFKLKFNACTVKSHSLLKTVKNYP